MKCIYYREPEGLNLIDCTLMLNCDCKDKWEECKSYRTEPTQTLSFEYCGLCDCVMIKCPICGNNSCNGGRGGDNFDCKTCDDVSILSKLLSEANNAKEIDEQMEKLIRAKDPKIIRVDDAVKVIKPLVFDRCGYPLCIRDLSKEVLAKHGKTIDSLISDIGIGTTGRINNEPTKEDMCKNKIVKALTYVLMSTRKFGGNNRSIYTIEKPEYMGIIGRVSRIKHVKTGERVGGTGYHDYYGDNEYEPPYLSKEKTHKILYLDFYIMDSSDFWKMSNYEPILIEACHVEKVMRKVYEESNT